MLKYEIIGSIKNKYGNCVTKHVKFTETTFINSASERLVSNTIKIRKIQGNIFVTFIPYNLRLLT